MERYSKDSLFTTRDPSDDEETSLEGQFIRSLPDLEKLEGNVDLDRSSDEEFAPPAFGDAGESIEKEVSITHTKLNYALVSMVAPEGTPQKSPMMAFKLRGGFNTYEEALNHQKKNCRI